MDICKHFRVRDIDRNERDPEDFIRSIEKHFHEDITLVHPRWRELIKLLHARATDVNRRIQQCKARKDLIAHKLFIESARLTPFELNDIFARTGKKWAEIEAASKKRKKPKIYVPEEIALAPESAHAVTESKEEHENEELEGETEHESTRNNTPVSTENEIIDESLTDNFYTLPPHIYKNPRLKFPSVIKPHSRPSFGTRSRPIHEHAASVPSKPSTMQDPWMLLKETSCIRAPPIVRITHDTLLEQTLNIPVTNISNHIKFIKYVDVASHQHFRYAKMVPLYAQKLYTQLPVNLKFVFKLKEYKTSFETELRFKVGSGAHRGASDESLTIQLATDFLRERNVFVPPIVRIPPLYAWHFKENNKYPSTIVTVIVDDDYNYHLHIRKRKEDVTITQKDVFNKNEVDDDEDIEEDTNYKPQPIVSKSDVDEVNISVDQLLSPIVEEIIDRSLSTFIFKRSYVSLFKQNDGNSKRKVNIPVYFTKIENVGCHNCYFDFLFIRPKTGDVIISMTCRVFADIIPHPLVIDPPYMLADLSHERIYHGYGENSFSITNTNKIYTAYVKIGTTKVVGQLLKIIPMKATIGPLCKVAFQVKYCTLDRLRLETELLHCYIKIYVSGYEPIYKNVPPFEYELVAPCATYYKHITQKSNSSKSRSEF